ncbi:MAG TPA: DNA starvation/stationary phase protection protein [Chitinophagaceae bacterium]|nr:DNA starvation/stationary phase protection protein [Chitinophagaceae bacterium]
MGFLNLDKEKTQETAKALNVLLADYHLYYQKLRNFHWNVVGREFFVLHEKFEELYNDAKLKVDEIAERILTLRYRPISNYTDYLDISNIKESSTQLKDHEMVATLLEDHGKLLKQLTVVLEKAQEAGDEGTLDLFSGYVSHLEKESWMLDAWLMDKDENLPKA